MNDFYFLPYEDRKPPEPLPHSLSIEMLWQFLAVVNLCIGLWYIVWRWQYSLNYEALWFAIPLALAETLALFGMVLFTLNLWMVKDYQQTPPPAVEECIHTPHEFLPEKISVDIFSPLTMKILNWCV
ncbi:MAG: hypothetical protein AB7S75_22030 [Desulfococcaceae bacterium]